MCLQAIDKRNGGSTSFYIITSLKTEIILCDYRVEQISHLTIQILNKKKTQTYSIQAKEKTFLHL